MFEKLVKSLRSVSEICHRIMSSCVLCVLVFQSINGLMNCGAMLHYNGKLEEAEDMYLRALKLKPDDEITKSNLAKLRMSMKANKLREWTSWNLTRKHSIFKTIYFRTESMSVVWMSCWLGETFMDWTDIVMKNVLIILCTGDFSPFTL